MERYKVRTTKVMYGKLAFHLMSKDARLLGRFNSLEQAERFARCLDLIETEVIHVRNQTREISEVFNYTSF